ncbi:MAG: radical SAM protein [Oligoflexia bacterium]|nr:radical SAM protein [Oligoflexia bacterium]
MTRILLLTAPMTQLNTPYPATAYLTGFLRQQQIDAVQADPAIELVLKLFSRSGLERIERELRGRKGKPPKAVAHFLHFSEHYKNTIDAAIRFLQGKDPSLALRIVGRDFLPEGKRFAALSGDHADAQGGDPMAWAFGALGIQDGAKYLASLMIDDLADMIREGIDPRFELSRYAEKLAASAPTFDPLADALAAKSTVVDEMLDEITRDLIERHQPDVVGITAPFPGNVYGAFRIAGVVKRVSPDTRLILGGGYVNTELRELKEKRVFAYFDYITLDDGERPLLAILDAIRAEKTGGAATDELLRTFVLRDGQVRLISSPKLHDIPHRATGTPVYDGLPLDRYLSIFEMLNPMHRIWSDGRWNKLTLAHGCYWKKCNFCDVTLDYIGRYDAASADLLVDRIVAIQSETGQSGFHFVDEAAPPAVLKALAERLIERGVVISWWGNIRFEKTFTPELTRLLARSGCVAVSGGLEVASDRLLQLMNKGVTVEQVARVTRAFTEAGVMVHAYLMYGFPSQTESETIDALERVRQLFEAGCIQSAYWHRFSVTAHSPIGKNPEKFGIKLLPAEEVSFARNDLAFEDPTPCDHELLGVGLRKALYNYMHGVGLDLDVRFWFEHPVPKPKVKNDLIACALEEGVVPGLRRAEKGRAQEKPRRRG